MKNLLFFDYTQKSSILLIFFFHALVFTYLLLKRGFQDSKRHCYWLCAFIFLGAMYIAPFMLGYAGWYGKDGYREFLFFIPFQQLFLLGPVFYFYVKYFLNQERSFVKKDFLHFLPAVIYGVYILIVFITDKIILDEFYFYADGMDMDLDVWYQKAGLASMLIYLFLSFKYYRNYRQISSDEVSFADDIAFKWIKNFIIAFGLILLLRVLFFILNPEWWNFGNKFWYYLCFSILLYYISITGYSNTIRATLKFDSPLLKELELNNLVVHEKATQIESEEINTSEWRDKLSTLFENEGLYKNPNLTLTEIALQLGTNRNIISKVINLEFEMNFNDFVNERRIYAVVEALKNGQHNNKTLLSIALECGFNSKTTFNRAFKKQMNLTPRQFLNKNQL